jgi:transcriptional regulator of acetoin/glycerol metabolism
MGKKKQSKEGESSDVAVVVVDRAQLEQLKQLLRALPSSSTGEEPRKLSWTAQKARQELQAIEEALQQTGGNITRAAKLLGMHRTTLWRKLKRLREEEA